MTTEIVVATRSGLAEGPDGAKYRLARGRTLADARHPLAAAHPELFAPYTIDLPYEGDEASSAAGADGYKGPDAQVLEDARASLEEAQGTAELYRAQLAAIADGLHERGLVPADLDTEREGWLAELVFAVIDRQQAGAEPQVEAPTVEPGPLPRPRKRAARPRTAE
jgi:hypothetical protein